MRKRTKRAHKTRYVQNEIVQILKMFKNNMKFTRAACWIYSKINKRDSDAKLPIFSFYHYCWSLLWRNYWRSLMLWNVSSWIHLKSVVQIHFTFHPCDPLLISNCIITGNIVEKQFPWVECKITSFIDFRVWLFKTFYWL